MGMRYLIRFVLLPGPVFWAVGLLLPACLFSQTQEKALEYRVGERARETIYAPETIRVTDPAKHPDVFKEVRNQIPPLYGYDKSASRRSAQALLTDWENTRNAFLSSAERVFGKRVFRPVETASTPFGYFVDSFQGQARGVPVSDAVARRWAGGDPANDVINAHVAQLEAFMTAYFIRQNEEPDAAQSTHEVVDLININRTEPGNLSELADQPLAKINRRQFLTESQAKQLFLRQTNLNRALKQHLSQWVLPNTHFLERVSIERWVSAQTSMKNEIIFEEGDTVVKEGQEITPLIKEALDFMIIGLRYQRLKDSVKIELAKENAETTPAKSTPAEGTKKQESPASPPAAQPTTQEPENKRPQGKLPPRLSPTTVARSGQNEKSGEESLSSIPAQSTAEGNFVSASLDRALSSMDSLYIWLIGACIVLLGVMLVILHFRQNLPARIQGDQTPAIIEDRRQNLIKALASHLTQTLFRQRQTLLKSKESATAQVAAMENRLAKLQPEIFDKLKNYEDKIKDLEEQLKHRKSTVDSLDGPLVQDEDETDLDWESKESKGIPGSIFKDIKSTTRPEKCPGNPDKPANGTRGHHKEVPFPGQKSALDPDDDAPVELMEEVLEDLEAEEGFENRFAKGSKP